MLSITSHPHHFKTILNHTYYYNHIVELTWFTIFSSPSALSSLFECCSVFLNILRVPSLDQEMLSACKVLEQWKKEEKARVHGEHSLKSCKGFFSMYIRQFHENTFFGNPKCPKWILGPWVNRNWCQKMRFSQICLLPFKLLPPPLPPFDWWVLLT